MLNLPPKVTYNWLWHLSINPKIKYFLWKISQNGLPIKKRLESSHVYLPLECVYCNFHSETDHHLLLDYPFGKDVLEIMTANGIVSSLPSFGNSHFFY